MRIASIGIVGWKDRSPRLTEALEQIAQWAETHPHVPVWVGESLQSLVTAPLRCATDEQLRECGALVAVGGDGTVLSAARLALGREIPIVGVNAGKVGFLAEYRVDRLFETLGALASGAYTTRPRMMLDCVLWKGSQIIAQETVLNEVQLRATEPERMVNLEVQLNGKHLTEYWADSLLVSTPTGSTAYNLSAGGPILHPATQAFVLNPVNPTSLSVRPLVIPAEAVCHIHSASHCPVSLVFDGRSHGMLQPDERLELKRSRYITPFVRTGAAGFVDALQEKLGWTGKPRLANHDEEFPCSCN